MIKRILVAYDEGAQSQKALEAAIEIAKNVQAELHLISAYKMQPVFATPLARYGTYPHVYERPLTPPPEQEERIQLTDVHPDPLGVEESTENAPDIIKYLNESAHKHYEALLNAAAEKARNENIMVMTHVESGKAGPVVVNFADSHDIDLIAIGARNSGPVNNLLFGSVSNYVIQNAPCLVLIAKD